jgi:prepilin-type processing-associated H-X9-DG protein
MRKKTGLTRIDVAVALACIALALGQAAVINAGGRERSKRELCLANLRMLTAAWQMYADNNGDKIINGDAEEYGAWGEPPCTGPSGPAYTSGGTHYREKPWVMRDWGFPPCWPAGTVFGLAEKREQIRKGALFPYVKDLNIYQCPLALAGIARSYSMVDAMNCNVSADVGPGAILIKSRQQIINPAERFVFLDCGGAGGYTMGGFTCYISQEKWWDLPPVSHDNGAAFSFADGHSAFRKWKSQGTIIIGNGGIYFPVTCDAKNDLYWVQIGCWGQLGYTPSCPVNPE